MNSVAVIDSLPLSHTCVDGPVISRKPDPIDRDRVSADVIGSCVWSLVGFEIKSPAVSAWEVDEGLSAEKNVDASAAVFCVCGSGQIDQVFTLVLLYQCPLIRNSESCWAVGKSLQLSFSGFTGLRVRRRYRKKEEDNTD